jgi:tetraacyldisaccharide 4'-kinase
VSLLLIPLSWVYAAIMRLRNYLYDVRVLKSVRFDLPVIAIGNLSVGGTGKTPHTEYLIRLLQYIHSVGTLSRGYGRRTHGFILADHTSDASQIGDEPMLYKIKYPDTVVAVSEDRVVGIPRMLSDYPDTDVILLDDAYQHRAVRAGLSILLTRYDAPYTRDRVMPAGWLREPRAGFKRADILLVTQCPPSMTDVEMGQFTQMIQHKPYQHLYFTRLRYGAMYPLFAEQEIVTLDTGTSVLLVTAIADPAPLTHHLQDTGIEVFSLTFRDHHLFDRYDLENIRESYIHLDRSHKAIITTEKDATRLWLHRTWFLQNNISILVQPIEVYFLGDQGQHFDRDIMRYIAITQAKQNQQTTT